MEFFSLAGDEGSYRPHWYVIFLVHKENMFASEKWQSPNRFKGWANTEPSTPVTYKLHSVEEKGSLLVFRATRFEITRGIKVTKI